LFCLFISYMWLLQQSRERDKEEKCLETWTPNSFTGSSGSWTAHMTLEFGLPHWNACTGTMFESAGIHFINNLWTGLWPTDYCSNAVTCNGVTVFVTFFGSFWCIWFLFKYSICNGNQVQFLQCIHLKT
jgi:hypothetical protein